MCSEHRRERLDIVRQRIEHLDGLRPQGDDHGS
jgi:hypothetical protein